MINYTIKTLSKIGTITGGSVFSIDFIHNRTDQPIALAATNVGLWRSAIPMLTSRSEPALDLGSVAFNWEPFPDMPASLTAIAVSPFYDQDATMMVGAHDGVFLTMDGGRSWRRSSSNRPLSSITAIHISPNFLEDGVAFLGTLEDGVFVSRDRGMSWLSGNFGLYDLTVYCLAISPNYVQDETIFLGAASGLYYSYNGGRAWRELESPAGEDAILTLAISPTFASDGILYLGTEHSGVFVSNDRGKSWIPAGDELVTSCINALALSPNFAQDMRLLCATDEAIFQSSNGGRNWFMAAELPGGQFLKMTEYGAFAGLWEGGVYFDSKEGDWEPAGQLSVRALTSFCPSEHFPDNGNALVVGDFEGIYYTADGGLTWQLVDMPFDEGVRIFAALLLEFDAHSKEHEEDSCIIAATSTGIWKYSLQKNWTCLLDSPTRFLQSSPDGQILIAGTEDGLYITKDGGQTWQSNTYPWQPKGVLLDCACLVVPTRPDEAHSMLAVFEPDSQIVIVYSYGLNGWQKVASFPGSKQSVRLFIPQTFLKQQIFFAALDQEIYNISARSGNCQLVLSSNDPIVALSGQHIQNSLILLAATGTTLLYSHPLSDDSAGRIWSILHDFQPYRPVALSILLSSNTIDNSAHVYMLTLGGELWQFTL